MSCKEPMEPAGGAPPDEDRARVAYFSMEIALEPEIPTYAGGLGVLAGDTVLAAADLGIPMVAVSLVLRRGHFRQRLDASGNQSEEEAAWSPEDRLEPLEPIVEINLGGRPVAVRAWRRRVRGQSGHEIPVYLLDTDLTRNDLTDRSLTDLLYGGDVRYRLAQEAVLGLGGVALVRALGHGEIATWHMNEGHSALLLLALTDSVPSGSDTSPESVLANVRRSCVFTTHTPVPAGNDQFPLALVGEVLGSEYLQRVTDLGFSRDGVLNMTFMALRGSHFVNGVAMRHREVSAEMFPGYPIQSITNGVHAATWVAPPFQALFDHHVPEWRRQNFNLRYVVGIPTSEIRSAHEEAKLALLAEIERRSGVRLPPLGFTIGFARRATEYKRPSLVFTDLARLRRIAETLGPIQIVFAGKAHPRDEGGKHEIRAIFEAASSLRDVLPIIYLPDYDMRLARLLVAGVDLWLNTPRRPQEASGTSGMKAALNGVPSLSVLDGWWIEGHVEGITGWSIDEPAAGEAASLYRKLEGSILPLYFGSPHQYASVMRSAISLNGSFFSAERMVFQYAESAYDL